MTTERVSVASVPVSRDTGALDTGSRDTGTHPTVCVSRRRL